MTDGAREVADHMTTAASAWLDMLDEGRRLVALGPAPAAGDTADGAERVRWFYTPTDHGGLTLHQQSPTQQRAAMRLLSTGLSEEAYATAVTIMGLENVLDRTEGFTARFDRERGRDPGMYYVRVFGKPGGAAPWGWRFGGHHVSVNVLVVGGRVRATTPLFLGADPASTTLLGGTLLRPLGAVEDLARELVRALPAGLMREALLTPRAPGDIVGANRTRVAAGDTPLPLVRLWRGPFADAGEQARLQTASDAIEAAAALRPVDRDALALPVEPRGVPGSALDPGGRALLRDLLATYLGRVPAPISPLRRHTTERALDRIHVAWAGSTEPGEPHYYRVQGPGLLLEWDNTQRQVNHAHSVWRDPDADFGADVLTSHLRSGHQGR